jgi:hypothetical protein
MNQYIRWAMFDPEGNIVDSTVMLRRKDAIYNGAVWGRCGDGRKWKDFKKEGYRVSKVIIKELRQKGSDQ